MPTYADHILRFLFELQLPIALPHHIQVLSPFESDDAREAAKQFYHKYYDDHEPRYCIVGINPGRFGGGTTGIPFTDPIRLEAVCGIDTPFARRQELSSVFMYQMIAAFGGAEAFYKRFYITSYSPLGFTKAGKNLNYYDDKELAKSIIPFVRSGMEAQLGWGLHTSTAFCLGEGKNFQSISRLNNECRYFDKVVPLAHPRFIMQYKLKSVGQYIDRYLQAFSDAG